MTFPIIPASTINGSYQISRSLRFRSSASAYLSRTPASAGNRKTWTWSGWVKRGVLNSNGHIFAGGTGSTLTQLFYVGSGYDRLQLNVNQAGNQKIVAYTNSIFRDPSAWYHVVYSIDTTQVTNSNGVRIYVNGVQQSLTFSIYTQNVDTEINNTVIQYIGQVVSVEYFDGYLAEVNFIDGQALTPSSFGAFDTNGVWQPAKYTGSYGTNGFYLNFSDNSGATATTIGKDSSGNSNNWTPNNISVTSGTTYDSMIDSPTNYADGGNGRGNYAVLNPLSNYGTVTYSAANLNTSSMGSGACSRGTIAISSGKWYWETTINAVGYPLVGAIDVTSAISNQCGYSSNSAGYLSNGTIKNNATNVGTAYATYTTNDVIGVALDMDGGSISFYKNGTLQATASGSISGTWVPQVVDWNTGGAGMSINFGQRPFTYTPPSGFSALNTQNLPTPTIANGAQYMAATIYGGTGSAGSFVNTVNNTSFKPDALWIKSRSQATGHYLQDSVRGAANILNPDQTSAEANGGSSYVTSFDNSGWSVGSGAGGINISGQTYVAWQWRAGNNSGTTNNDGFVTSTVSANTTAGFSIATYTGNGSNSSVGHGLGVAPSMIIVKSRSAATNWTVYHSSVGTGKYLNLNTSTAPTTDANFFTSATSTLFSMTGSATSINTNAATYVAYCFAPVAGYSAFGSLTGNGSADGVFVYLGFKPKFVMWKASSTTGDWQIWDATRDTYNVVGNMLAADLSNAEATGQSAIDILSNGFKCRSATVGNNSGVTYVYAAFAEAPFKYSRAR